MFDVEREISNVVVQIKEKEWDVGAAIRNRKRTFRYFCVYMHNTLMPMFGVNPNKKFPGIFFPKLSLNVVEFSRAIYYFFHKINKGLWTHAMWQKFQISFESFVFHVKFWSLSPTAHRNSFIQEDKRFQFMTTRFVVNIHKIRRFTDFINPALWCFCLKNKTLGWKTNFFDFKN